MARIPPTEGDLGDQPPDLSSVVTEHHRDRLDDFEDEHEQLAQPDELVSDPVAEIQAVVRDGSCDRDSRARDREPGAHMDLGTNGMLVGEISHRTLGGTIARNTSVTRRLRRKSPTPVMTTDRFTASPTPEGPFLAFSP